MAHLGLVTAGSKSMSPVTPPSCSQVLMPSLVSVCYGSERVCATLSQHMDLHLLRDYVQVRGGWGGGGGLPVYG